MKLAGGLLLVAATLGMVLPVAAGAGEGHRSQPRVMTDGRLRPGHLETIRISGFPGRGDVAVSFFPTAICEDGCGARSFRGGRTSARGAARFRVRVPGTFFNINERHVYFRDGERIEVNVTWEGADRSFSFASADPEPILVRHKGHRDG